MRYYGWQKSGHYSTKEPDAIRHRPTKQWFTRYLHKVARKQAKKEIKYNDQINR